MVFAINIVRDKSEIEAYILKSVTEQTTKKSVSISKLIRKVEPIVEKIAADIASGKVPIHAIEKRIQHDLINNTWMYGLGMAFTPYTESPTKKLSSSYYVTDGNNQIKEKKLVYDYTLFEHEWYRV